MLSAAWPTDHGNLSWSPVTREKPCPVCGKPDWCRVAKGGRLVTCHRSQAAPGAWRMLKGTKSGGGVFALDDGLDTRTFLPRTVATVPARVQPQAAPGDLWGDRAKAWQDVAGDSVQRLAGILGVDAADLHAIGCGWDSIRAAWTFPVRDGTGVVVGIAQRFEEPHQNRQGKVITKAMVTGSRQGLFYDPRTWSRGTGPILLVEGASDTAAAMTMGLSVIGRPSNRGGIDHLADLLRAVPESRTILVVGERDQKGDGNWPGRDGAIATATGLAKKLHRAIGWAIVPDEAKDTREFLQTVTAFLGDRADPHRTGKSFAAALVQDAAIIEAAPAPILEPQAAPAGPARDLASWRRDVAAARLQAVSSPGLHLDRSQTGSGKTYATVQAIRGAANSLTVLPTHANVRERVAEMQAAGIDAVAFPELDDANCQNYSEAARAQAAGLPVGRSACIGCQFKRGCEYRAAVAVAKKSSHRVGTHERLIRSPGVADGAGVVVIDENPARVLQPSLAAGPAGIRAVGDLAHRITMQAAKAGDKSGAMTFAMLMNEACDCIESAMKVTEPGRYPVILPPVADVPRNWQAILWRAMQRAGSSNDPDSVALQLVTKAATGELDRLDVVVERTAGGLLTHLAFGSWRTPVAQGASYQLLDATACAADVAAVAGLPVNDCTPDGFLPMQQQVVQIPLSVTSRMSPVKAAAIVRAILNRHPEYRRVGLIGHSAHVRAMMGEGSSLLDPDTRSRIAKACYFWQGPDRASNDWHQVCDVVLVLGVPRPNPVTVRQQLLLLGLDDAATIPAPVWGDRHWQATSINGGTVTVPGRGYHHPDWHRAHQASCRSQLLQAMGRSRAVMPDGVPCLVVADEPTGAVVDTRPLQLLPDAVQGLLDVMRRLGGYQLSRIGTPYTGKLISQPVTTRDLRAAPEFSGMTYQALAKRLDQARKLGVIHTPGRGLWEITDQAALPVTVTGPAEPVSVGLAMADAAPLAAVQVTTTDAPSDGLDDLRAAVDERAAFLEFDAGLDRDEADRQALAIVLGPQPSWPHYQAASKGNCTTQSARPDAIPPPETRASFPATGPMQGDLWSHAHLRQLNPWG